MFLFFFSSVLLFHNHIQSFPFFLRQSCLLHLPSNKTQFSSVAHLCPTLCDPMDCSMPGLWSLLRLMSIESVMPSNHPLSSPSLPAFNLVPSIRVFSNESVLCIRWPKYWSFSFNISPSNEYSGLISFRMDWLDLLAVQGTLKSLPATPPLKFKSINSLVLSFLYSPTLTSIHDYWKNHSFDWNYLINLSP